MINLYQNGKFPKFARSFSLLRRKLEGNYFRDLIKRKIWLNDKNVEDMVATGNK